MCWAAWRPTAESGSLERLEHTTAVPPPPVSGRVTRPRHLQVAAFLGATAWYLCAVVLAQSAASGISYRIGLGVWQPVLQGLFEVFLVVVGISLLAGIDRRRAPLRLLLRLPLRKTARTEWAEGAALGWGIAAVALLVMLPAGAPSVQLWTTWRSWEMAVLNVAALGLFSLAFALGLFGFGFQRLIDGVGAGRATILMCLLGGIYAMFGVGSSGSGGRVLVFVLAAFLLCLCWLRTHGLWLLWGLAFAWVTAVGVLFGLPIAGSSTFTAVVDMRMRGPVWLTGGDFGPIDSLPMLVLLVAAIIVLVRMTSDYAWNYTHAPIIPGGYPVDVPSPAAHNEMERTAVAADPVPVLVQIVPATPQRQTTESGSD